MRDTIEAAIAPLLQQIRTSRVGDLLCLMIAESSRFPQLVEFYCREVLDRAMRAIETLAREAMARGELAGDELVRFPQIVGTRVLLTLVWTILFDKIARLDQKALLSAYLDLVFGRDSTSKRSVKSRRSRSRSERPVRA